jgi:hypothetical protein
MRVYTEEDGKKASLLMLSMIILSFGFFLIMVKLGLAPGLEAGHPPEYLTATFIAVGVVLSALPIMWYFDIVRMPLWFTALLTANLYYYAISMFFGMYLRIVWWGDVAHCVSSVCVCALVFLSLCILQANSPKHVTLGSTKGILVLVLLIGICFGGLWEVMEGYVDIITGTSYMVYGIWDSLMDIRADTGGAIIMVILGYVLLKKHTPEEISSTTKVRLARKKKLN